MNDVAAASAADTANPVRYERVNRSLYRCLRNQILVTAPGRPFQLLQGSAAVVFALLDEPLSLDQLLKSLGSHQSDESDSLQLSPEALRLEREPENTHVQDAGTPVHRLQVAIDRLLEAGLIREVAHR